MQKDTSEYQIKRANELSKEIDAALERPEKLLREFNSCCSFVRKYRPDIDLSSVIRYPENW